MILLFELIIITSLLVLSYTIATQEGMVFYKVRQWANYKKEAGHKWTEPIFLCHWCQPSSWSLISFGFAFGIGIIKSFQWDLIIYYILTVCGSSLLNGLIWGYHLKSNSEKEMNESIRELMEIQIEDIIYENENKEVSVFDNQHN